MEILKKMSVGAMNGVTGGFKDVTESKRVARILGIVRSIETKDTNIGRSYKFTGEFRGINAEGEEFSSPVCYLPAPADSMLLEAFTASDGQPVGFAFDIFVNPKPKKTPVDLGYEYKIKPLLETKPSDPLLTLMKSAESHDKHEMSGKVGKVSDGKIADKSVKE
jgi:hypothetical protein